MKSISKISIVVFGLTLILNSIVWAEEPNMCGGPNVVASAIDRQTKAIEDNTKAIKEQTAAAKDGQGAVGYVADVGTKAAIGFTVWQVGSKILTFFSKAPGPGAFIIIPDSVLKNMMHPGGSDNGAMNDSDGPKQLEGTQLPGTGLKPEPPKSITI